MKLNKKLIKREIAGDVLLVPIGKSVYDSNGLFVLNETANFLWDQLESCEDEADLIEKLLDEYEVSYEEASKDVQDFLGKLRYLGIIDEEL
jgi:hypothetical protein